MTENRPVREAVFTVEEVARIAGLAKVSVNWNIKQGYLKATRKGKVYIIFAGDLEEWLKGREGK